MNHRCWIKFTWLSITAFVMLAGAPHMAAQATPTATAPLDVSAFAGFSLTRPYWGSKTDPGISFGFDLSHNFKFPIVPSLEARANLANGPIVNERIYLFGVRADPKLRGRFHPYGDFLLGPGNLHYVVPSGYPGYVGDDSVVKSIGGGVDFDVYSHFQIKVDVQYQFWNFGSNYTLTPTTYMFGINYRLRTRNGNPR
jgi:hypothetical protein